jgi:hypothetical protein
VRADVDEDPAVPRRVEEPLRPVSEVERVRAEADGVHDEADPTLLDEVVRAHHGRVRESLGEQHEVLLARLRVRGAQRRELLGARRAGLVGEHVLAGVHGGDADFGAVAGDRGGDHDVDVRERVVDRGDGTRRLVLRRQPRTDPILGRHDRDQVRASVAQTRRELHDVQMVGADDSKLHGYQPIRPGGACSARARCRA